jgi:hypothetical protein
MIIAMKQEIKSGVDILYSVCERQLCKLGIKGGGRGFFLGPTGYRHMNPSIINLYQLSIIL